MKISKSLSVLLFFLSTLFFNESTANDVKEITDVKDQINNKELTDDVKEQAESQRDKDEEKETDTNEAAADGDSDDEKPISGPTTTKKNVSKKDIEIPRITIAPASARLFTTECLDESKADFKDVDKIKNGDWDVIENDEIKKFALCYMVKFDLMSPQGVLKLDHTLGRVHVADIETMDQIIDACLVPQERNIDTAWNYLKCYSDRVHKYPILIRDN